MIIYKTKEEIEWMRGSNRLVSETISLLTSAVRPGTNTLALDLLAGQFIRDNGGIPSFLNYHGYPFNSCISVNDAVVHGFPDNRELREGDIISIDIGVFKNGFHGDSAYTIAVQGATPEALQMMKVTKASLYKGIEKATVGNRIGDIAWAIQEYCERTHAYGVVRELVGHGIGRTMHEDPQVPNFGKRGNGPVLKAGMTLAIEPMVNLGKKEVYYAEDGWTVKTKDGKVAAHFEHSICVQKDKADILSTFAPIEKAERENANLVADY